MSRRRFDRLADKVLKSKRWRALRLQALRRDGFRCVQCGAHGRLEVDHIKRIKPPDFVGAYDLENLQTLCVSCHSRKTISDVGLAGPLDPERQRWRELLRTMAQQPNEDEHA